MKNSPEVMSGRVANVFSRQMHFKKAGDVEFGHTHPFDHLTLLAAGRLKVVVNGEVSEFTAPYMIYIKAECAHELVALEDNTVAYCILALREKNGSGDILDPAMIPKGVSHEDFAEPLVDIEMTRV